MADLKISQLTGATTPLAGTEVLPVVQSSTTKQVSVANLTAGRAVAASSVTLGGGSNSGPMTVNGSIASVYIDATGIQQVFTRASTNYISAPNGGFEYDGSVHTFKNQNQTVTFLTIGSDTTFNSGNLIQGTAAKGVNFTANTPLAGMTSQLLNWYEEGTFTPAAVGGTTPGTGTYTTQVGRYTRIGNRVMFNINLNWSAHTGSGDMTISGLPFTSNSTSGNAHSVSIFYTGFSTLQANNVLVPLINANSTVITMYQTPAGGGTAGLVTLDTSAQVVISGHYEV